MILVIAIHTASAKVIDKNATIAGLTLYYKVILPHDYDPDRLWTWLTSL